MWYKHNHRRRAHRTEHRGGGGRAVLTQTSAAPGGMIHLLPSIQSCPALGPVSCLFKPLWLSSKEDQGTHWARQQLPSASSINFQPPWFFNAAQNALGRWGLLQAAPMAQPALLAIAQCISWQVISEGRNWFWQWNFWNFRQCSIFSSVVQSVFAELDVWS